MDVGSPLDDEPLQEETLDDVAATAGWLGDNTEKGVADQPQTPGAEGPKHDGSLHAREALDDVAAEVLANNKDSEVADELQTPGVEYPTRGVGTEVSVPQLVIPTTFEMLSQPDVWICDTGASSHSTNDNSGARNEKDTGSASLGHAGQALKATMTIDLLGQYVTKDGTWGMKATLTEVNFNASHNFNLMSLTRLLTRGWRITRGDDTGIYVEKGANKIDFDIVIRTPRGAIFACRFIREEAELTAGSVEKESREKKVNIKKAHELMGHMHEDQVRKVMKQLQVTITRGTLGPCKHCAKTKAKQKNVCKESRSKKASKVCERVYMDLSKVTVGKTDGSAFEIHRKWWRIVVDELTGKKWLDFTATKKAMPDQMCRWMNIMKANGKPIQIIRMDPGGENLALEKLVTVAEWKELQPVKFEVTSRETPQHNPYAELAFPYLGGIARAMMSAANVPEDVRGKVVLEALTCACMLDGLVVVKANEKIQSRDEHVHGKQPKWIEDMHRWGEAGVVKEGKNGKAGDRGTEMMFVGYSMNRESDSKRMWDPATNRVVVTRDIIWMKQMLYRKAKEHVMDNDMEPTGETTGESEPSEAIDEESSSEEEDDDTIVEPEAGETVSDAAVSTTRSGRITRVPDRLIETMTTGIEWHYLQSMQELEGAEIAAMELILVGAGTGGGFENTKELKVMNYKQAMLEDPEGWTDEVAKEKARFDRFNALTAVKRKDLPKNSKIMTTTWAMKRKASGKLRGRLNARGYEQVEGKHYFEHDLAAPVTNATSIRVVLTLMAMHAAWIAKVLDVDGAFLQGQFYKGERLYIGVPSGFEKWYGDDEVLLMNVPLYGTKQAANCFYKMLIERMKKKDYKRSKADPCLYYIYIDGRLVVLVSWVDDIMILGHPSDVESVEKDFNKLFECTCEGHLTEYVGSKIDIKRKPDGLATVKFTQPVLVQKLKDEYIVDINGRSSMVPAVAGQILVKGDGSGGISEEKATKYRSATATLMYIMQWSRPDIYNATRGQSRHMKEPREAHDKALQTLMKHVVATAERGLVLAPTALWNEDSEFKFTVRGRSDSDYAGNTDDRKSITGAVVYVNDAPVAFRSSTQRTVTLSVTEAEGSAGVTCAQDMLYVYHLIESLGQKVNLPMLLEMDNKGAVQLANNWSVGGRTRHVDVRNHFLRELKDMGIIEVRHVPGDDNDADIFTKNVTRAVFDKHVPKLVGIDKYCQDMKVSWASGA